MVEFEIFKRCVDQSPVLKNVQIQSDDGLKASTIVLNGFLVPPDTETLSETPSFSFLGDMNEKALSKPVSILPIIALRAMAGGKTIQEMALIKTKTTVAMAETLKRVFSATKRRV